MKKLRVGFLVGSTDASYYVSDLINYVNENELFESPILITRCHKDSVSSSFSQRLKTLLMGNKESAVDEPLEDAYLDVSNYGIMATVVKNGKWGK